MAGKEAQQNTDWPFMCEVLEPILDTVKQINIKQKPLNLCTHLLRESGKCVEEKETMIWKYTWLLEKFFITQAPNQDSTGQT